MPLNKTTQEREEERALSALKEIEKSASLCNGEDEEHIFIVGYITGKRSQSKRAQQLEEALEKIRQMKLLPGEKDYKYAFNRCWHIAFDTLN